MKDENKYEGPSQQKEPKILTYKIRLIPVPGGAEGYVVECTRPFTKSDDFIYFYKGTEIVQALQSSRIESIFLVPQGENQETEKQNTKVKHEIISNQTSTHS